MNLNPSSFIPHQDISNSFIFLSERRQKLKYSAPFIYSGYLSI